MEISDVAIEGIDVSKIESIYITHSLNDISSANVSFIATNVKQIASAYYNDVKIKVGSQEIFNGVCMGVQTEYNPNAVNIHTTIQSSFHKLVQIGLIMLGIVSPDGSKGSPLSQINLQLTASITDEALKKQNIIGVFKLIIDSLFNYAKTSKINDNEPLYKELYETITNKNKVSIDDLFSNFIDYKTIPVGVPVPEYFIKSTVTSLLNSQNLNLWSFLMTLCDYYMLCTVTTFDGKNKIIVHEPFSTQDNKISIDSEEISSISISPIQHQLYTRLLLTTDLNIYSTVNYNPTAEELMNLVIKSSNYGWYPALENASKLTKLEEKLQSIKTMRMTCPGALTWKYNSPNESQTDKTKLDKLAKALWLKETLKYRSGIIGIKPNIKKYNVGDVVVFEDSFFNKKYQGQITKITLNLSGNQQSMSLYLQYVIEDSEKDLFEYTDLKNPLYETIS